MKKIGVLFVICTLAVLLAARGAATEDGLTETSRTVRVAYPIQAGLSDIDEYGAYTGYTYEYLEEIAQYTGWNYEFVQVPGDLNQSLIELMEMLQNGEIDLMGAILYSEESGKHFDYATQSYGVGETVLQVLYEEGDIQINSILPQSFRVATTKNSKRSIQELNDYCQMNMVTPEYVYCESTEEMLAALREDRADMILNSSVNYLEGVRTIARFAPKPFYFVTYKGGDAELMAELNAAIMSIQQADPSFTTMLYEKYFMPKDNTLRLSEAERDYVEKAGTLRVGVLQDQPPYQYVDGDGEYRGFSADLLRYITERCGLHFEGVYAQSVDELYGLAKEGKVDLVAAMPYDYGLAREQGLSMSRPYVSSQYLLLMKQNGDENTIKGKRLALLSPSTYQGMFVGQVVPFESIGDCIQAVADGEADYAYVDAYTAQYYLNMARYRSLKSLPQTYTPRQVCFGVVKPGSRELLSILNKIVSTIPDVDMQGIINQNALQKKDLTLTDFLQENPVESIAGIAGVLLVIIAILLFFLRQRAKLSRKSALELKKHYRVYALVNEYFFEYNYQTGKMIVSFPKRDEKQTAELREFDFYERPGDELHARQYDDLMEVLRCRESSSRELYMLCIDGEYHWLSFAVETVMDGDTPAFAVGKINIVDEERREKDVLRQKAQLDSLTRVYNNEASRKRIEQALAALKNGEHGALILVDIDCFKDINDSHGHMQGDRTLRRVADLLRDSFRPEDVVGRPGGDEFIIYIQTMEDRQALIRRCQALRDAVHGLKAEEGIGLTISFGAALCSKGDVYGELYQLADEALYAAKRLGRDRFQIADGPISDG